MVKRLTMILAGLFVCIGMAMAQSQVTGIVVDDNGEPVVGAAVKVVGTNTGTQTKLDGTFSLSAPANSSLEISYLGMQKQRVKAGRNIKVTLEPTENQLDQVMVVAYGKEKRSSFTGSATVVGSDEIGKVQVTSPVEALRGKAAGVQMVNASGAPGSTSTIRIRGISSINAGNDPLIVVDGAPFDGDLNTINPADIENMTVLKDASSTALYGARGSNGVILITTKSAKAGQGSLTVDVKLGSMSRAIPDYNYITSPAKYYETWYRYLDNYAQGSTSDIAPGLGYDAVTAHNWANSRIVGTGTTGLAYQVYNVPEGQDFIGMNGKVNPNATLGNVVNGHYLIPDDWVDATFHNGLRQEYNVTGSGANDRGSFYLSFNYLNVEGLTIGANLERYTARLKADYKVKKWLKLIGNISYAHYRVNGTGDEGESNSSGNVFALTKVAPIYPLYNRDAQGNIIFDPVSGINSYDYGDGSVNGLIRPYLSSANPLSANQLDENGNNGNTFNAQGTAEITLPYGFTFSSINNVYVDEARATQTTNPFYGQYASSNGIVYKTHNRYVTYDIQQQLNWAHSYGNHNISAQVGHDYYDYRSYGLSASRTNQFSPDNDELDGAVLANGLPSSSRGNYNTEGYISRVLYNYAERYFFNASYVHQASSRFAKKNRWGDFWSLGGAWMISKEKWFKAPWVDELRLKVSYGENGNDNIGSYLYTNRFSITPSNGNASIVASTTMANEDITWETQGEFNAGVDFSLWNGRLYGNVEYFLRKTGDMLFYFSVPPSYQYFGYYDNIGDMKNTGVEFTLNGDILRGKDYVWSANLNFSYDHNWVSKLPDQNKVRYVEGHGGYTNGNFFVGEGLGLYTYYMPHYEGVDPSNGQALYRKSVYKKDQDGKVITDSHGVNVVDKYTTTNQISEADYYLVGNARPEVFGGFGTSGSWHGIDASIQFSYQLGGKIYDGDYQSAMGQQLGAAMHADLLKAWTPTNTKTSVPRLYFNDTNAAATSDRWLTSASYLSLDNIQVGYTLPKQWVRTIGLSNLRVYVSADNIWIWTHRQGLDPRQSLTGGANSTYHPSVRTVSGGITVTF